MQLPDRYDQSLYSNLAEKQQQQQQQQNLSEMDSTFCSYSSK